MDRRTDDSFTINKNYSKKIILFSQPNKGQAAARNIGIKNAKGDYITFWTLMTVGYLIF